MMTMTNQQGIGYSGKSGGKAYLARITGIDGEYGFARDFVEASKVERDHFGRARYTRTYTYELSPGLYEEQSQGERCLLIVWVKPDGKIGRCVIPRERVEAMCQLMDAGSSFEEARLATRAPVAVAVAQ